VDSKIRIEPHPFLRCGDWVQVKSGPLADVEGILLRKKGSCRLIVSMHLLGKSVAVEVDAWRVQFVRHEAETSRPN
jgi:transcription antitermination factor NusG